MKRYKNTEHYKKIKQAEAELDKRIKETSSELLKQRNQKRKLQLANLRDKLFDILLLLVLLPRISLVLTYFLLLLLTVIYMVINFGFIIFIVIIAFQFCRNFIKGIRRLLDKLDKTNCE